MPGPIAVQRHLDQRVAVTEMSDSALVISIARGSHDALAEAHSRHGASVLGLARHMCGPDRAADVAQEVFLALWRSPERFDGERGPLRPFLLVQARARAVDVLRSDSARRARDASSFDQGGVMVAPVDDVVLARLAGREVWRLLSGLVPAQRRAITLAYFGGHTYREVAELLELPEGTVKSRIRAGLGRLRSGLPQAAPRPDPPTPAGGTGAER